MMQQKVPGLLEEVSCKEEGIETGLQKGVRNPCPRSVTESLFELTSLNPCIHAFQIEVVDTINRDYL